MSSPKPVHKPENRISGTPQTKKPPPPPSSSSITASKPSQIEHQQQQTLKCPRCNSPNTKFCYYNNYSLSQPRHFCKSCRRYWTRGGALRNVPIGGGCRKTKKSIKSIHNNTTGTTTTTTLFPDDSSKFFAGLVTSSSQQSPDFASLSLTNPNFNQSTNFDIGSGLSLMNFGEFQSPAFSAAGGGGISGDGSLASSIETLSCLNQDLHWRLQQQRMAMLFGNSKEENVVVERPQPILYRNLEILNSSAAETKKLGDEENNQTEWYFGNINDNQGVISNNNINNHNNNNTGGSSEWSNGIQAWTDLNHYNALN